MTAPEDFLTLWRTAAPGDLLADRELPARLLAFLAARLEPRSGREKRLLDRVLRDGGAPAEAFRLARLLSPALRGVPSDFTMSWVLWSAQRGHDGAIMALAQCLMQRAAEVRATARNAVENDDPATAAIQAGALEQLALAWLHRVEHSILGDFHHWLRALDLSDDDEEVAERLDEGAAPAAEPAGAAPTLQVLKLTSYQKAFEPLEEYAALAEPLPLKGGEVRPELMGAALELELPHMAEAIDCIVRDLELRRRAGVPWVRFRPLLLVGPPGTGKTRLARSLARLLGTGHGEMGVGGVSDNRLLEGTARGWRGAQPCWPLLVMRNSSCANPVLLVDEIDKARASDNGDVMATLLGMLESETARTWFDSCLLAPADLSQISWILTANTTAPLPRPLLSRLRVVHVGHPGPETFDRVFGTAYGAAAGKKLKTQYRMLPAIGQLVSDTFYPEIQLEHGRDTPEVDPSVIPSDLGLPLTWIETDSLGEEGFESLEAGGTSRINRAEADCILTLLTRWYEHEPFREWLTTQTKHPHGVGVICMYAAQRDHLRNRLLRAPHGNALLRRVKVDTVDSYQGKENPIIVLSFVRNNADGPQQSGAATVQEGFLSRSNRINVSISRAMDRLVLVGSNARWPQGGPMRRLAHNFAKAVGIGEAALVHATDVLSAGKTESHARKKNERS